MTPKKIGIIGAGGRFGRWFDRFFRERGCPVVGADKSAGLTVQQAVEASEVVVFCGPLRDMPAIAEEALAAAREDQLWIDISSAKARVAPVLARSKAAVVLIHPLFAPPASGTWRKCRLAVCSDNLGPWRVWFSEFLRETEAEIRWIEPARHDRVMLPVQNMVHASALAQVLAFAAIGARPVELLGFSTKLSRAQFAVIGRLLSQSPELYADIQMENPDAVEAIDALIGSLGCLRRAVADKDRDAFIGEFVRARSFLGDQFLSEASAAFENG
jgi:prephenate dehydrogenase